MRPRFRFVAGLALAVPFMALRAQDDAVQQRFKTLKARGEEKAAAECDREGFRQSGKRGPTKPATERLFAITKEHPEVAKEGAPR